MLVRGPFIQRMYTFNVIICRTVAVLAHAHAHIVHICSSSSNIDYAIHMDIDIYFYASVHAGARALLVCNVCVPLQCTLHTHKHIRPHRMEDTHILMHRNGNICIYIHLCTTHTILTAVVMFLFHFFIFAVNWLTSAFARVCVRCDVVHT